jgi:hypothetical protein
MFVGLGLTLSPRRGSGASRTLPLWVSNGNLFTGATDLDNAAWTKSNVTIGTSPGGYAGIADTIIENADTAQQHTVTQSVSVTSGVTYVFRALVKLGSGVRRPNMVLPANRFTSVTNATFDIERAIVAGESNTPGAVIRNLGDGHCEMSIRKAATSTGSASIMFRMHNGTTSVYNGDGTSSMIVSALGFDVYDPLTADDGTTELTDDSTYNELEID